MSSFMIMVVVWLACGMAAAVFAGQRQRSQAGWFLGGLLLGPLGILLVLVLPKRSVGRVEAGDATIEYTPAGAGEKAATKAFPIVALGLVVAVVVYVILK